MNYNFTNFGKKKSSTHITIIIVEYISEFVKNFNITRSLGITLEL